jgi:DNA-binding NarL/FixJ family response regulator
MSNTTAPKITKRESQVIDMIGQGFRNKQIAMALHIAEFTVRKHRANILWKLGLSTSAQLVAYAASSMAPAGLGFRLAWQSLRPREAEIARLLVAGLASKEIARALAISPLTVRKHRQNIFRSLSVHSLAELAKQTPPG